MRSNRSASFNLRLTPALALPLSLAAGAALSLLASCSLVNAPDEVRPGPVPTTSSSSSSGGGAGGAGGEGGAGGAGGMVIVPVCPNGVLEPGEECDDGNQDMADACSPDCKITEFDIEADPSVGNEWPGIGTSGVDGGKGFFVIWRYLGDPREIRGRAYKSNGQRVTQSPVKLSTTAMPDQARIGTTPGGLSIVAWRSFADASTVHYRVVDPDGKAVGPNDELIAGSESNALVSVGANSAGKLGLMWMAEGDLADPSTEVRVRCFDEAGSLAGTVTQQLAVTNSFGYPGVWGVNDGFVASWNSDDGKLGSMQLDGLGAPVSAKFSLATNANANSNPFGAFVGPALQFIAVFEQNIDLNGVVKSRITKRLFDAPGMSQVLEDLVSTNHAMQYNSRVAHYTNGKFIIVWAEDDEVNGEDANVVARVFNPNGTPVGPEFTVNQVREGYQTWPGVAVNSDGDAMIVWDNNINNIPYHISGVIIPRLLSDLPK